MIKYLSLILLFFLQACIGQKSQIPFDLKNYSNSITATDLKEHLYTVASNEMQGRNTGSDGQKKAGKYLISHYEKLGISFPTGANDYYQRIPSSYFLKAFSPKLPNSENIWGYIEGTDKKDEVVVISAHYDHVGMKNGEIYNGADDDGSGTVTLLELAEAFALAKKEGRGPRRSILFLHVTGEEYGLHGSRFYTENPLFPLKKTIANINIDMIGRHDEAHENTSNYVYVIGSDRLSTDLDKIVKEQNQKYLNLDLDYKYNDINHPEQFYYRSDHYNFAKNGVPAVFFFSGIHEDYHKPGDDPEKIEYDALAKRAQLAFVIAWELAMRDTLLTIDRNGK